MFHPPSHSLSFFSHKISTLLSAYHFTNQKETTCRTLNKFCTLHVQRNLFHFVIRFALKMVNASIRGEHKIEQHVKQRTIGVYRNY